MQKPKQSVTRNGKTSRKTGCLLFNQKESETTQQQGLDKTVFPCQTERETLRSISHSSIRMQTSVTLLVSYVGIPRNKMVKRRWKYKIESRKGRKENEMGEELELKRKKRVISEIEHQEKREREKSESVSQEAFCSYPSTIPSSSCTLQVSQAQWRAKTRLQHLIERVSSTERIRRQVKKHNNNK